ncbi:MAG: DUF2817 domain-containing protein [Bacteriovoracaceae bacterium]
MKFELIVTGKSVNGLDIPVYKSGTTHANYIYLMAGTHGDESETVFLLEQLFAWLKCTELPFLPMIIIPALNPDGLQLGTRTNGNKVDLNRNYLTKNWLPTAEKERYFPGPHPMSEPENQFLAEIFKTYPPAFILTFHTWKPLIDYDGDALDVAQFISERNGYPVTDYIGYPTPGSFGTYIQEQIGVPVITFESPDFNEKSNEEIWKENEQALKDLFLQKVLSKFITK